MMDGTARWWATVIVCLMMSAACGNSVSTSPTPTSPPPVPAPATPPTATFPPLDGPSRTFTFDHELSYPVSGYTKQSRFVLYDNGAFVLQYVATGGAYRGKYDETNGAIAFTWQGWSSAGPWGATGKLAGDSLTVQYNLIMQLTDFEDAAYTLTR
jgi:hypothetical protein